MTIREAIFRSLQTRKTFSQGYPHSLYMTAGKYSGHEYKMMQVICGNDAKKGYTLRYPLQDNSNDTGKERESRYQIVKNIKQRP